MNTSECILAFTTTLRMLPRMLPQVIEYQMAPNVVEYVHRVGRTARAGRRGRAVSLFNEASENEASLVKEVQRCVKGQWKYL